MEVGDASMLGSCDLLTLVLVCAGICCGRVILSRNLQAEGSRLAIRGLTFNLLCGDFIEACYPYMKEHVGVSMSGYLASAISVGLLNSDCKSSAYLPFPVAVWLADDWRTLLVASIFAFVVPFMVTVLTEVRIIFQKSK
jgi:hypothetical protein